MWCPEGFITLFQLRVEFAVFAIKRTKDFPRPDDAVPSGQYQIDAGLWQDTAAIAYGLWMFHRFVDLAEWHFFAAPLGGRPMKLAAPVLDRFKFYDGDFPDTEASRLGLIDHLSDSFLHINPIGFVIEVGRNVDKSIESEDASLTQLLMPLSGLPVCYKTNDISLDDAMLSGLAGMDEIKMKSKVGRKPKVPEVERAYLSEFPSGHGNLTLKEIAYRIRGKVDFPFEIDTLKRAIGQKK